MKKIRAGIRKIVKVTKFLFSIALLFLLGAGTNHIFGWVHPPTEFITREVERRIPFEPTDDDLFAEAAADYRVSVTILRAIKKQESGNQGMRARRFEPKKIGVAARYSSDPFEQHAIASSHCMMQVMGYNAEGGECKSENVKDWQDLNDRKKCIRCAAKILADRYYAKPWNCIARTAPGEADRCALLGYNGGSDETYDDRVLAWAYLDTIGQTDSAIKPVTNRTTRGQLADRNLDLEDGLDRDALQQIVDRVGN